MSAVERFCLVSPVNAKQTQACVRQKIVFMKERFLSFAIPLAGISFRVILCRIFHLCVKYPCPTWITLFTPAPISCEEICLCANSFFHNGKPKVGEFTTNLDRQKPCPAFSCSVNHLRIVPCSGIPRTSNRISGLNALFFRPSATKSGRPYGVTSASSLSLRTPPPPPTGHWLTPPALHSHMIT